MVGRRQAVPRHAASSSTTGASNETDEGPYDPARATSGINSLAQGDGRRRRPAQRNVYCELGTTWREVMSNPTEAATCSASCSRRMGEDRVLWGTDADLVRLAAAADHGVPRLRDHAEFQERFGYPALTPAIKKKVFGTSAAELFGIDPMAMYCGVDAAKLDAAKATYSSYVDDGTVTEPWRARGPLRAAKVFAWLRQPGARLGP